jgi:predicted outer membrane protein
MQGKFCYTIINKLEKEKLPMVGASTNTRLITRRSKMEFQKIDFAKLFDLTVAIDNMEKGTQALITYMPEAVRDNLHSINQAQFSLIRTTNKAVKEFAEVVESVGKETTAEVSKAVQKATKLAV